MITDKAEFDLRYTEETDLAPLIKWLKWPGNLTWYPMSTEQEIEVMAKNWVGFYRYRSSLTACYKGKPVGIATLFLMPYRKVAHMSMLYFIVNPKFERQGVGTALIRNINHLAKTYFRLESIHFDIFEGCPAHALLLKLGYKEVLRQKKWAKEKDRYLGRILMEVDL